MLRKLTIALLVGGVLAGMTSEALAYRGWGGHGWGGRDWGGHHRSFAGGWGRGWGGGWGRGYGGWGWGGLGLGVGLGSIVGYGATDYPYYGDYGYNYPAYTTAYTTRYGGCW